ncbi:hypothetical protein D3C85_707280 [compost metagenome]
MLGNIHIGRGCIDLIRTIEAKKVRCHTVDLAGWLAFITMLGVFNFIQVRRNFHQLGKTLGRKTARLE